MEGPWFVQSWSVRNELKKDFRFTLKSLAEMGYAGVEFGSDFGGLSAAELRELLESLNLRFIGAHVTLEALEEAPEKTAAFLTEAGCESLTCAWSPADSVEAAGPIGDRLAALSERYVMQGLELGYHNHSHEFSARGEDGTYPYDALMERAELLLAEPDVGWIAVAGASPEEILRRYAGRVNNVHLRQMGWQDGKAVCVPLTEGVLDLTEILSAARLAGARNFIVEENGDSEDPLDVVRQDLELLKRLG